MMIPLVGHEPEGSVITVGDGVGSGLSASARADDAAIRADARVGVHLHVALPVTDGHRVVRQWPRRVWTAWPTAASWRSR
jgi:hypothetical protein